MTPDSFLNWLLSREWDYRVARNIERLVKSASYRYNDASVAQIDYTLPRGLDRNQMERLASLEFIRKGDNLFITGYSGTGKSYLATALGYEACKAGLKVLYANAPKLMGSLKIAKNKGVIDTELKKLEKAQLLILDDLFLVPLDAKEHFLRGQLKNFKGSNKLWPQGASELGFSTYRVKITSCDFQQSTVL